MKRIAYIHDLVDPSDPQGRTYKEINTERIHNIPIGALVEIEYDGTRAFVVHHGRDCDMTPLYSVSLRRNDTEQMRPGFANFGWRNGLPEDSLTVIDRGKND